MLTLLLWAIAQGLPAPSPLLAPSSSGLDEQLQRWWLAESSSERAPIALEIIASGASFDAVREGLRRGREYSADAPTGYLLFEHEIGGVRHPYLCLVPGDYTPDKRYPVRFDLHGGMGAKEWKDLDGSWASGWKSTRGQIIVFPAGWYESMWWERSQVENFEAILRKVRATWNIDENRIALVGNSDGGAAVFFQAMRTSDSWSCYAAHVGPPDRLTRADFRPDGQMHMSNLLGQRFHLGYGGRDTLVPWKHAKHYLELFEAQGADLDWYVLEDKGHNLELTDELVQRFSRFISTTVRDPLPDRLSWATEDSNRYARRSWVVIDKLRDAKHKEDVRLPRFGTALQLRGPTVPRVPYGRVDVDRSGNRVSVTSSGVAALRLLISTGSSESPEFDLSKPIVVELNGTVVFEERVEPSLRTLLAWCAIDDERERLFAAEIELKP